MPRVYAGDVVFIKEALDQEDETGEDKTVDCPHVQCKSLSKERMDLEFETFFTSPVTTQRIGIDYQGPEASACDYKLLLG